MFAARLVIEADLTLLSPLHVGTGEVETHDSITYQASGTKERKKPFVATVMRDDGGWPVVPGASVKGVLRSLAGDGPDAFDLFGSPTGGEVRDPDRHGPERKLWRGRLTAYAMRYGPNNDPAALTSDLPFADREMKDGTPFGARGLYVAARTAIKPGSGTADDKKLFYQEMVAPGAVFRLRLELRLDRSGNAAAAEACLLRVLQTLRRDDGVAFGKGQSLGQGRFKLAPATIEARRLVLDAGGKLADPDEAGTTETWREDVAGGTPGAGAARHALKLTCDGPFLIDDPSVEHADDSGLPRLNAQQHASVPLLPGSTLAGALRARAGWLAKLRWNDETKRRDCRDKILAKGDEAAAAHDPRVVTEPADLSPTERLFGVTGWRGLVRVVRITCEPGVGFENITSVKLDRFSMAPIDGALFTTRAAIDPVFEVVLEVEKRGGFPGADDQALFAKLLEDLRQEGIMLGHGTSRGYGWFGVTQASGKQP